MRLAIGFLIAALVLAGGAGAAQPPVQGAADPGSAGVAGRDHPARSATAIVVQLAAVTQQIAQVASAVSVTASIAEPARAAVPVETPRAPAASAKAGKAKLAAKGPSGERAEKAERAERKLAAGRERRVSAAARPLCVRTVGHPETGTAAWYGGRYVGRRTTSGERLDTVHPTAAHRTLPLNSLARVTNLDNGRSVIVRVTDRGPVNDALLIDMSPKAAAELHMKEAGLIPVKVEQVVEVPSDSK